MEGTSGASGWSLCDQVWLAAVLKGREVKEETEMRVYTNKKLIDQGDSHVPARCLIRGGGQLESWETSGSDLRGGQLAGTAAKNSPSRSNSNSTYVNKLKC